MRRRLGALELEVMQIIWDRGEATVRQVWEVLYPTRKLAYTTVATVIRQIEEQETSTKIMLIIGGSVLLLALCFICFYEQIMEKIV